MKKTILTLSRLVLTPVLLLATGVVTWALFDLPIDLHPRYAVFPAIMGFAVGATVFSLGCRFSGLYVLGHELTHYLTAKLFLRRTGPFAVGIRSGSVSVERPNIAIVLAPYVMPLFTLLWIGFYGVFLIFRPEPGLGTVSGFYAGIGVTYAYHVVMTVIALWRVQQDVTMYGSTFSLSLIAFGNTTVLFTALMVAGRHWSRGPELLVLNTRLMLRYLSRAVAYIDGLFR